MFCSKRKSLEQDVSSLEQTVSELKRKRDHLVKENQALKDKLEKQADHYHEKEMLKAIIFNCSRASLILKKSEFVPFHLTGILSGKRHRPDRTGPLVTALYDDLLAGRDQVAIRWVIEYSWQLQGDPNETAQATPEASHQKQEAFRQMSAGWARSQ